MGDLDLRCYGLEAKDPMIHDAVRITVDSVDSTLRNEMESLHTTLVQMRDIFQRQFVQVLQKMEELSVDVSLCKRAMA